MFNIGYSRDVTALPTHWLGGITAERKRYGSGRQHYGGAMRLGRIGTVPFYGVMRHIDFQESRWYFLGDGGAVDLFGGRQASLY